jgi:hypothetical protein
MSRKNRSWKETAQRLRTQRQRAAANYEAIALADTELRRSASGPTSFPVKRHDAATEALIAEALRERGMA